MHSHQKPPSSPVTFKQLYRQDLLVASLFRNYLLAERILHSYSCKPVTHPELPPTYHHPLWEAWDMALDHCLAQLPALREGQEYQVGGRGQGE